MQIASLMHMPCSMPAQCGQPVRQLTGRRSLRPTAASRQHDALAPVKMAGAALAASLVLLVVDGPAAWPLQTLSQPRIQQAPTAPAALAAAGQPRGDTQFTSNTDYQRELQQLIEERGGVKSLLPGVSPAPSDKNDPNNGPDKSEFKLAGKVRETVQDAPNSLVEKALPGVQKAGEQLPSPPKAPSPAKALQEAPKAASQAQRAVDAVKSATQAPKQALDKAPEAPKQAVNAAKEAAPTVPSDVTQAPKQAASRVSDAAPKAPGAEVLVLGAAALALVGGVGLAAKNNDPASSSAPSGGRTEMMGKQVGGSVPGGQAASSGDSPSSSGPSSGPSSSNISSILKLKDPQLTSDVARQQDPFFAEVRQRIGGDGGNSSSGKSSSGGRASSDVMKSKDPTIPSSEAKKRDPFFAGVKARTNK